MILNATNVRANLYEILKNVIENNEVIDIKTKQGSAVIISKGDYDALVETLYLSSNSDYKKTLMDGLENVDNDDYWIDESEVNFGKI